MRHTRASLRSRSPTLEAALALLDGPAIPDHAQSVEDIFAAGAGLRTGERIVGVAGEALKPADRAELVHRLRGQGGNVALDVMRDDEPTVVRFPIRPRDDVLAEAAYAEESDEAEVVSIRLTSSAWDRFTQHRRAVLPLEDARWLALRSRVAPTAGEANGTTFSEVDVPVEYEIVGAPRAALPSAR